nr:allergen Bos d 2-like [Bubalus bubalis]
MSNMGENSFQVTRVSENMVLLYGENFDGIQKTKVTYALGKGDSLTEEDFQRYEELTSEKGIPNENIDDATKTDNCPK